MYHSTMKLNMIVWSMLLLFCSSVISDEINKSNSGKKKSWKDKDIRDMTEADLEHLLDQWEENDEPLEPDELPEHLRPSPPIDMSKIDVSNPDNFLKVTKKGKGVMMFVDVDTDVSVEQADVVMRIWQSSLQNNHIIAERYPIDERRSVFLFREGSQAVDAKAYLLEQPELSHLTLEGQTFYGNRKKEKTEQSESPVNERVKKAEL